MKNYVMALNLRFKLLQVNTQGLQRANKPIFVQIQYNVVVEHTGT